MKKELEKEKIIKEISKKFHLSITKSEEIGNYLADTYILKKKNNSFFNQVKRIYKMDSVDYYLKNEKSNGKRLQYIDVAKAIAMIFIYIGHWESGILKPFAYSFHLNLFFLVSGFFALHYQKYNFIELLKKLAIRLVIPLFLWASIAFIIDHLNQDFKMNEILNIITKTDAVKANYWFIPALFTCIIGYWFLAKIIKKPWVIVLITYILSAWLGANSFLPYKINLDSAIKNLPLHNWITPSAFFTYGIWYALGTALFPIINKYINALDSNQKKERMIAQCFSYIMIACTVIIFLHKSSFEIMKKSSFFYYHLSFARAIIIIISILFFSSRLKESEYLNKIGKNTMIYVGMEFIIHNYIALTLMLSLNLGIYNFVDPISIITYNLVTIYIISKLVDIINKYFPILNGIKRRA